ncbi:MAG: zinc dependent phospholipase C family protein [Syntrophobacterales bacterium]
MAGTFTHWMVVERALTILDRRPQKHDYFPIILGNNHFVTLGAVGPDYPYLNEVLKEIIKLKHHSWADRMHYENIEGFVINGIHNLQKLTGSYKNICLSWFCGLVTHLIVDASIHPVVNAIVGPYIFNSEEHRHCEMIQDSFIFRDITKTEICYAAPGDGFLGLLRMCSDPDHRNRIHPAIRTFWTSTLEMSYPGGENFFDKIVPDEWHESFISKIETSADPIYLFRHMGEDMHIVYKTTDDINAEEREKFIDNIKLPGGKVGNFKDHAFNKAVKEVIEIWTKLFDDIANNTTINSLPYIKNWNLDLGVDMNNCYFWDKG